MNQEQLLIMTDVREVWLFMRRNIKLIAFVAICMALFALLLALVLPSRYNGETIIMPGPAQDEFDGNDLRRSDLPADNAVVRSEIDVIKSHAVINRVVDDLDLMKQRRFQSRPDGKPPGFSVCSPATRRKTRTAGQPRPWRCRQQPDASSGRRK